MVLKTMREGVELPTIKGQCRASGRDGENNDGKSV